AHAAGCSYSWYSTKDKPVRVFVPPAQAPRPTVATLVPPLPPPPNTEAARIYPSLPEVPADDSIPEAGPPPVPQRRPPAARVLPTPPQPPAAAEPPQQPRLQQMFP